MRPDELREEIAVELEALEATVNELLALQRDVAHREPTIREKTAAAAFLAQFTAALKTSSSVSVAFTTCPCLLVRCGT